MIVVMKDRDGVVQRRHINPKNFDPERMAKITKTKLHEKKNTSRRETSGPDPDPEAPGNQASDEEYCH